MMFKRCERTAAHRVNIGQRIRRRDLAVAKRVVHDGREKIHRLHEGAVAIEAVNTGVIRRVEAPTSRFGILDFRKLTQNLRQSLLAQLGRSTGAGRKRSQFENLLARHAITSFPMRICKSRIWAEQPCLRNP